MKLVVAFVQDYDSDRFLSAITSAGMAATKVASLGGFLRVRNSTIFMGIEDDRLADCIRILESTCRSRAEVHLDPASGELAEFYASGIHEVTIGGAVVFVVGVSQFVQLR